MGGFLQGILGAAGEDIVRERKQRYAEDLSRHQMRLEMLSNAAQHAQTPEQRAEAFRQMDEINNEPIGGGGKKRGGGGKAGQPGRFEQMGEMLQRLMGAAQNAQSAQTPPFLPPGQAGVFKNVGGGDAGPNAPVPYIAPIPNADATPPTPTPIENAPAVAPAIAPIPNVQLPELPPSRYNAIFGTQGQKEGLEDRGARLKMGREMDELRGKGKVGLEIGDAAMTQKLEHVDKVVNYLKQHGVGPEVAREEAERIVFGKAVTLGKYNMAQVLFKRPDTGDKLYSGLADLRRPGVVYDADTGEQLEQGTYTLMDKGLASVAERGKFWGEFGNYYRAAIGRGMADADARRAAGDMVMKKYGVALGRTEQQMAIDQSLSGIGQGPGIPPSAVVPPAPTPGTGGNAPRGAPSGAAPAAPARPAPTGGSLTPPLPPRRTAGAGGTPLTQGGLTPRENDDVLAYLSSITGTQKGSSKAGQVRQQNGLRAIARVTGLDPMTLTSRLTETPALAKQIGETIQRAGAIQRLNNTIDTHGRILVSAVENIAQTNSPLLNRPVREWRRKLAGSPELKRFDVARNELQREYAYLTSGGAQSRAMLPVGVESKMDKLLSDDITPAEVAALVDQISIGAHTEKAAMDKTVRDLQEQMMLGPAGQATGADKRITPPAPGGGGGNTNRPKVRIISVQ